MWKALLSDIFPESRGVDAWTENRGGPMAIDPPSARESE